jgi:hypothetical protein
MQIRSNINEVIEQLKEFQKPFVKIENDNGSTIVEDAQFTTIDNKLDVNRLSISDNDAISESAYLDIRQGANIDQDNVDDVINRFIRDYLEELFK